VYMIYHLKIIMVRWFKSTHKLLCILYLLCATIYRDFLQLAILVIMKNLLKNAKQIKFEMLSLLSS